MKNRKKNKNLDEKKKNSTLHWQLLIVLLTLKKGFHWLHVTTALHAIEIYSNHTSRIT